jgi:hypothetical protein
VGFKNTYESKQKKGGEETINTKCHGLGYFGVLLAISWRRIFWDTFWQYHGLGYFGILLAISWPILEYFWQYHGLGYFEILFGNIMA